MNNSPIKINKELADMIGLNEAIALEVFSWQTELEIFSRDPYSSSIFPITKSFFEFAFSFWNTEEIEQTLRSLEEKRLLRNLGFVYKLNGRELEKLNNTIIENKLVNEIKGIWNDNVTKLSWPKEIREKERKILLFIFKELFNHDIKKWEEFCINLGKSKKYKSIIVKE